MTPKAAFLLEYMRKDEPRNVQQLAFDCGTMYRVDPSATDIPTSVGEVEACLRELEGWQRVKCEPDGKWHWLPEKAEPVSKQTSLWGD